MSETEAYIQLIIMVGIILCLPYIWVSVIPTVAKIISAKFFPPKFIDVEIIDGDHITFKRINLENDEELINALLSVEGKTNE
ncbi:hypothetical protein [uncultured Pseudoalteromonas sp.]|uniref:hypothetical protein n=1 Tax=uncultured Pseudoalteromonas sp. TaxID=114053 RepID=UPI002599B894|nr:hypothetical protein [uncultured Pseudoalteromonas sp.]